MATLIDYLKPWRDRAMSALNRWSSGEVLDPSNDLQVHRGDPLAGRFSHAVYATVSDMRVNPDTATQVAAIWACMDVIASALSSSDWNVYEGVRGEDNKKALPRDPLQYLLNTRWNTEMTAQAGKRAVGLGAAGWGNGYAEIEWDQAGRIRALWPIAPHRVEARRDMETMELFYRVTQEYRGGWVDLNPEDLYIIRGASYVGFTGDNLMARAVRTVANALAIDAFSSSYFSNNAQLGTVFMYKGGLMDDVNYTRAKEQLNKKHSGVRRAYSTGLFTGEWDIKTFGKDMQESLMAEVKAMSVDDICRWWHVPPHKIAHLAKATNNNIEHQGLEFSRDTMRPWRVEAEQEGDYKLISMRGPNKFIEIDMDWAEQGDYKSRLEAYSIGRTMGAFSANDVLRKLGENTIGEDGDIRIVQGANVRLEDVGAAYTDGTGAPPGDPTLQAWLTTVYARVQRRKQAGAKDCASFARELVNDLAGSLGARLDSAHHGATAVMAGADPVTTANNVVNQLLGE